VNSKDQVITILGIAGLKVKGIAATEATTEEKQIIRSGLNIHTNFLV